jgi:uncharacterized membrane protein
MLLLAAGLLAGISPAFGTVSVKEVDKGGGITHLQVTNEYFDMEFAPEHGAQAMSFKTRYSTNEWVFPGYGGLFKDNFVGKGFTRGDLPFSKRTFQTLERGPEKVTIDFQVVTKDNLVVLKKMTFAANSPVVRVELGMTNQGAQSVVRGLWPKWDLYISGLRENNRYFRPDVHGVSETGWNEKTKYMAGDDYVRNPYAGWTAALNTQTGEGLVWLLDYNWLKWLYNCNSAWTVEWFYDYTTLPKGEKWETEYDMLLVKGFPGFCYASSNLVAGMTMGPAKPGDGSSDLVINHFLSRSLAGDLRDAKLTATLRGVDSKEAHPLPGLEAGALKWEPKKLTQSVKVNLDQRLVCDAVLTGATADGNTVKEEYSFYWPGINGEKFDLMAGASVTTYYRKPPHKVKAYAKPKDLTYYRKPSPRMLEFRGFFHQSFHIPEAATRGGIAEIRGSDFKSISFAGNSLSYVPSSFDEMFEYDLIVMNNVDASCLTDFGLEAVREFVKAGGNLLVLGGSYAFGAGGYKDSQLAELLPVVMDQNFDMKAAQPPAVLKVASSAKILKGVPFKAKAYCYWFQEVNPRPEAWVELTAEEAPFLICGRYGKGKVVVVAGNVCGDTSKAKPGFWDTDEWVDTLSRVIRWMVFED